MAKYGWAIDEAKGAARKRRKHQVRLQRMKGRQALEKQREVGKTDVETREIAERGATERAGIATQGALARERLAQKATTGRTSMTEAGAETRSLRQYGPGSVAAKKQELEEKFAPQEFELKKRKVGIDARKIIRNPIRDVIGDIAGYEEDVVDVETGKNLFSKKKKGKKGNSYNLTDFLD